MLYKRGVQLDSLREPRLSRRRLTQEPCINKMKQFFLIDVFVFMFNLVNWFVSAICDAPFYSRSFKTPFTVSLVRM